MLWQRIGMTLVGGIGLANRNARLLYIGSKAMIIATACNKVLSIKKKRTTDGRRCTA